MRLIIVVYAAIVLLVAGVLMAQQYNSAGGSLTINGISGPPYPIDPLPLPVGVQHAAIMMGAPNAPFLGYAAPGLRSVGFPVLGGQLVDLQSSGLVLVFNGLTSSAFALNVTGFWVFPFTLDSNIPLGTSSSFQAVVADPSAPQGATLTAATRIVAALGITVFPLVATDDGSAMVNLSTFSTNFPFYNTTHTSFYINYNGFVSFNSPDTDFSPSPCEMLSGVPRIAPFWVDLAAHIGGNVNYSVDQSVVPTCFRIQFTDVPELSLLTTTHTFTIELDTMVGNFRMISDPFNIGATGSTSLTGMSPGGNTSPITALTDLSALLGSSTLTQANACLMEFFGPASGNNFYDLTGTTFNADRVSPGVYLIY
jgi:hypothetical protein